MGFINKIKTNEHIKIEDFKSLKNLIFIDKAINNNISELI